MNRLAIILALTGWALYGYSALGPRSFEAEAQAEITHLRQVVASTSAERDKVATTLEQLSRKNEDLQHVQKQIAAAAEELKHLEYLRARVSAEIDAARPQPTEPADQVAAAEAGSEIDTTRAKPLVPPSQPFPPSEAPVPAAAANTSPSKEDVRDAQKALTMLGYGQLNADGVFGPSTRRLIEAFQQAQGLSMTGGWTQPLCKRSRRAEVLRCGRLRRL
jgi:TolA-binding protein